MNNELHAIVRLLRDDDPETVNLVKEQLAGRGSQFLPDLREMLSIDDERVSQHVAEVAASIDAREAESAMVQLCTSFPQDGDLESAAFLLARVMRPGTDEKTARAALDEWGRRLSRLLTGAQTAIERVLFLGDFLGNELKLRGNTGDYYNPNNSMLSEVIQSRRGIPITLALVYILVGHRAGLEIEGVNFPGHFLARHDGVLFDPFDRGRVLSEADCHDILDRQSLTPQDHYFEAAPPLAIFTRILANLLYIYQTEEEEEVTERLNDWIRLLTIR